LRRVELDNLGDVKSVGESVYEMRLTVGPGYRLYYTRRGQTVTFLLAGGDKSTQDSDVRRAKDLARNLGELNDRPESFRRFDVTEHLTTEADMMAYLEACLEDGDPKLIAAALGDIARARGMSQIARDAGIGRESCTVHCPPKAIQSSPQS